MTYRHKRDQCIKNTKDIIEKILGIHSDEYDLAEKSQEGYYSKSKEATHFSNGANILVTDTDSNCSNFDEMENYQPCQEFDFEVAVVKEVFEKKKKRRNYLEFREDCEKNH